MNSTSINPYLPLIVITSSTPSISNSILLLNASSWILKSILTFLPFLIYARMRALRSPTSLPTQNNLGTSNSNSNEFSLFLIFVSILILSIASNTLSTSTISSSASDIYSGLAVVLSFTLSDWYLIEAIKRHLSTSRISISILWILVLISSILHSILIYSPTQSLVIIVMRSITHIGFDILISTLLFRNYLKIDSLEFEDENHTRNLSHNSSIIVNVESSGVKRKSRTPILFLIRKLLPQFFSIILFLIVMILPINYDYVNKQNGKVSKNVLGTITSPIGNLIISLFIFFKYFSTVLDLILPESSTSSISSSSQTTDRRFSTSPLTLLQMRPITPSSNLFINIQLNPLRNSQSGRTLLRQSSDSETACSPHSSRRVQEVSVLDSGIDTKTEDFMNSRRDALDLGYGEKEVDIGLTFNGQRRMSLISEADRFTTPPSDRTKSALVMRTGDFGGEIEGGRKLLWGRGGRMGEEEEEVGGNPFFLDERLGGFSKKGVRIGDEEHLEGSATLEEPCEWSPTLISSATTVRTPESQIYSTTELPSPFIQTPPPPAFCDNYQTKKPVTLVASTNYTTPPPSSKVPSTQSTSLINDKRLERNKISSRLDFLDSSPSPVQSKKSDGRNVSREFSTTLRKSPTRENWEPRPRFDSISFTEASPSTSNIDNEQSRSITEETSNSPDSSPSTTSNDSNKTIRPPIPTTTSSTWSSDSDSKSFNTPPRNHLPNLIVSPTKSTMLRGWNGKIKTPKAFRNSTASDESFFCFSDKELQLSSLTTSNRDKDNHIKIVSEGGMEIMGERSSEDKIPLSPGLKGFRLSSTVSTITKKKGWFNSRPLSLSDQTSHDRRIKNEEEEEINPHRELAPSSSTISKTAKRKLIPRTESSLVLISSISRVIPLSRYSSSTTGGRTGSLLSTKSMNSLRTSSSLVEIENQNDENRDSISSFKNFRPYCPSPIGSFDLRYSLRASSPSSPIRDSQMDQISELETSTSRVGETSFSKPSSRLPLIPLLISNKEVSRVMGYDPDVTASPTIIIPAPLKDFILPSSESRIDHDLYLPNTPTPTSTTFSNSTVPSPLFSGEFLNDSLPSTPYSENFPFSAVEVEKE